MKNKAITIAIVVVAVLASTLFVASRDSGPLGSVTRDTIRGNSNTYTTATASTTASELVSADTGRVGLEIQNIGSNDVYVFLQATSTGVVASEGIKLVENGAYTPEFTWVGPVYGITSTGTSTVIIQETK